MFCEWLLAGTELEAQHLEQLLEAVGRGAPPKPAVVQVPLGVHAHPAPRRQHVREVLPVELEFGSCFISPFMNDLVH